jgi:hypothetical protein
VPSLAEIQLRMRHAVVNGHSEGIVPMLVGGQDAEKRLAVHRRQYETSLVTALLGKFPATAWLAGTRFVTEAARRFVRDHPPHAPCIAEYGEEFPRFLSMWAAAERRPYLSEFAELEWHLGHVAVAVDGPALSPEDFSALEAAALPETLLVLQPAVRYVRSSWPIDELLKFYLSEAAPGLAMLVCASWLITSIWALPAVKLQTDNEIGRQDDDDGCGEGGGPAVRLPTTKLFIEHNSTDEDTGVHGAFEGIDWQKLCVFDPSGKQVLEVEPKGQLRDLSISGIFFESREPPNEEVPIEEILARFPKGLYSVRGRALDGRRLKGAATFTHDIPAAPVIVFPQEGGVVSSAGFTVVWNHVTTTLEGDSLKRTGYEVIITKDVPDDPHGFSRPTFDVHVSPSETSLTVPSEFLEPSTKYELEVLVLEVSGNQTISSLSFKTQ